MWDVRLQPLWAKSFFYYNGLSWRCGSSLITALESVVARAEAALLQRLRHVQGKVGVAGVYQPRLVGLEWGVGGEGWGGGVEEGAGVGVGGRVAQGGPG